MAGATGGDKLRQGLDDVARGLAKARSVRVGFLENARYPDGTLVALVAAANEFGDPPKRPPRPFFRGMIRKNSPAWSRLVTQMLKEHGYDAGAALADVGDVLKGQMQAAINTYVGPSLSPKTIARKGFDKQLVDTAHMLHSVEREVVR